ncbi:glycoside hydrolase family 2 TIM barrel-domain containing protein [Sphingobium tyrosinilyticum]|uniref:glycoside hydrolase family 2 TIM barrel-domain containing protein n=1 Tax=Sphingobium tyrosinilyticum TaxID=2715436 RepID=UPI0036D4312B
MDRIDLNRRDVLIATGASSLLMAGGVAEAAPAPRIGRGQSFDLGWRFHRGAGHGFEAPGFNDGAWRAVDLPHDWSIEDLPAGEGRGGKVVGPFAEKAEGGTAVGFAVGGEGWYRKRFRLSAPRGGRVELLFDGVYMDSDVWLNGHPLGSNASGYTPFAYDLTPHLSPSGENVIVVRVRNEGRNSRWYSGSGIYRHVWLDVLPQTARIERWGVVVNTRRIANGEAELDIATALQDAGQGDIVVSRIKDAAGKTVWQAQVPVAHAAEQSASLNAPNLWSPDTPNLYTLETELRRGGRVLDRTETVFGVRIVTFDATTGMTINGTPTKLRGGCIHHDNGLLGACAFDAAEERKVALLKARGYNAVRPSHNLFSPAFFRACDKIGLFVVGETFDTWHHPKKPQDYSTVFAKRWRQDLDTIIRSTRNHPSVVMWSIGNEIPDRNTEEGMALQWQIVNAVHRIDPTRPVTAAINGFPGHSVTPSAVTARAGKGGKADDMSSVFLDLVGYNYKLADYGADHARFPDRVFFGTESFAKDVVAIWDLTDRSPWLIGDFVWTAMDYLGEASIGGSTLVPKANANMPVMPTTWPWVNADCGDIDLIGQQKAPSLARDVVWGISPLEIAVQQPMADDKTELLKAWGWSNEAQSWTWPGSEGKQLAVRAHSSGDKVELHLNGKLINSKAVEAKRVEFSVPYAPGTLEAVAFRGGKEIGRRTLTTVGKPAAIRVTAEKPRGGAGRGDVSFLLVEVVDAQGRRVPGAKLPLTASLSGPADMVGFGGANPQAIGSYQASTAESWDGRAQLVVRGRGSRGTVGVEVKAAGLASGRVALPLT